MKKVKVPIFTEEYIITVEIRKNNEDMKGFRGKAYNRFPEFGPLILLDGTLPYYVALATLAHEASHAMDYIEDYINLKDVNGEFRGHGIGAVVRAVGRVLNNPKLNK